MEENKDLKELKDHMVVAIIPAYNEEKRIFEVINESKKFADKVIVIDDGSLDKTREIAEGLVDVCVSHKINSGKGTALKSGFEIAKKMGAKIVVALDADGQHDPKQIPEFVKKIVETRSDILIGARALGKNAPIVFRFGNFVLNTTFGLLYGQKITDTQSGYRAFLMDSYDKFKWESSGYDVETEMLANACKNKLKISEIRISTKYHNKYKGTTIFDGMVIFMKMLFWKVP